MATQTTGSKNKDMLNNMKYEVAGQIGVNLKQGYNGDITSKQAGQVGGQMVKKMIEQVERSYSGQS
ncbi:MAG: alpha/beta-type small acid-soluble spore protein [Eubacteriales bacterium]